MEEPTRIILIGCVKGKQDKRAEARELYTSDLFRKRRAYAESTGLAWGILSAKLGVILPTRPTDPYEYTISDIAKEPAGVWPHWWSSRVGLGLCELAPLLASEVTPIIIELHAGAPYVKRFRAAIEWAGLGAVVTIETPMAGKQIGEQLSWYKRRAAGELGDEPESQLGLFA